MQLGICRSVEEVRDLLAARPDYVEENVGKFLIPQEDDAAFAPKRKLALESPVPAKAACCFLPRELKVTGEVSDMDALTTYAGTTFRRASEIGMETIVFGSGGSRMVPEGFSRSKAMDQFVDVLKRFGPLAEKHGVTMVVEPLHSGCCNFVTSLAEGAEAVERCDHPNVWLLADAWHMAWDKEPVEEILKYGHLLRHCHIAELEDRAAPGTRGDDFVPFFKALKQMDYTGRVSMECQWKDVPTESKTAFAYLRDQQARAGV